MKVKMQNEQLEEIVRRLEENAESENYHDIYPIYRKVANMVTKHANVDVALKVMSDIEDANGFMD